MPNPQNHLANETSPYLLQHAHNPVAWFPWGEKALQLARDENKLILLSIGYSACHWCHVMAHESFEDQKTAELMNQLYINIKVDREERPDLDKIYQTAHHFLNQRGGGWPLTMILAPNDHTPFFAGTYFPNQPRHGMPTFHNILQQVHDYYWQHTDDIHKQNISLKQTLNAVKDHGIKNDPQNASQSINPTPLDQARRQLEHEFDATYGGFGAAPKFPHPTHVERLLRHWWITTNSGHTDDTALNMVHLTLRTMARGGIYDQLGGGFCRYSVDERWMIPHFEKMLYDNGPLLNLYTDAWAATHEPLYQRIANETGEWVMRDMQSPEGGYYSTLDADSEGEEGKFYVWTPKEVKQHINDDEYQVISRMYGLDQSANFENKWHLHQFINATQVAEKLMLSEAQVCELLSSARSKLLTVRNQRIWPGRDEKILTSWNGLMIKGMATAGARLGRQDFINSAQAAVDFIHHTLYKNGRLLVTYKNNKSHLMAYLDDYVFLIDGLLAMLQARWRDSDLKFAMSLADSILEHFEDPDNSGFYFTAHDHEQLIHRPKPMFDEATPAGNGIAAYVLGRLGHLLGENRYLQASERTIKSAWHSISQYPQAHGALLLAVEEYLYPPETIVIRGIKKIMQTWKIQCNKSYAPRRMHFAIPSENKALPGILAERKSQGDVVAYVCSGTTCHAPVTDLDELVRIL